MIAVDQLPPWPLQCQPPVAIRVAAAQLLPVQIRYVDERLANTPEWQPRYETEGAAGFDVRALAVGVNDSRRALHPRPEWPWAVDVHPGRTLIIGSGVALAIPPGYELQIRGRSSLNAKGLVVTLGTIDSDYRGEIGVTVVNLSGETQRICAGDRIAQGVIAPVVQAVFEAVDELPATARGAGGFGSTGVR